MAYASRQPRSVRFLSCEEFEARLCLSGVSFASHDIVVSETNRPLSVFAADLDGDGDVDVLSASLWDDKIAWYENTDGKGSFGEQKIITTDADSARSVYAADLDGDGDVDVLSASTSGVAWYENTDGKGSFGRQKVITTAAYGAISVYATDVDGDGDVDVLSASSGGKIAWYENTDGMGSFGPQKVITTAANGAQSVYAADLDGDGDVDVLSASSVFRGDGKIAWYENTDGMGNFGPQKVISTRASGFTSVYAADLDGDGDVDVLSASRRDRNIAWYENTDGKGSFGEQQVVDRRAPGAQSVYAADLDGDGDVDVLSAASQYDNRNNIAWYENTDGQGTFGRQQVITTAARGAHSVYATDVDGDGDVDVLSASFAFDDDKIAWYENTDGKGNFGPQHNITTAVEARGVRSVYAADVDGDGDVDVLSASYWDNKIAWYENTDGKGNFGPQHNITTAAEEATSVYAADLDGDGDMDVLSASYHQTIAWYENTDGKGSFSPQMVITTEAVVAYSVYAADVDGDGDVDVLSASSEKIGDDNKIAWYENTDGKGSFGPQKVITTAANGAQSVYAADLDGDGDVDVLSASRTDNKIAWYENTDGQGSFGPQKVITTEARHAQSVYAADVDGDGDVDVLSAGGNKIAWYENTDGRGSFGPQKVINTAANGARSVYAADLDGDGDVDVLSASVGGTAWHENTDGKGSFGEQQVINIREAFGDYSVYAADLDGDGDVDVLSAGGSKVAWYENLGQAAAGDANRDFQFDQQDLEQVLQAAKYLTGEAATFEEGDWNGDGVFDQLDIVAALQTGNYLQGPYAERAIDAVFREA